MLMDKNGSVPYSSGYTNKKENRPDECRGVVSNTEFLVFPEHHHLGGNGLGFVDIHLLAATVASGNFLLTLDKTLLAAAPLLTKRN